MKVSHQAGLIALFALGMGVASAQEPAAREAPVRVNTYGMPTFVAERVEAAASRGITSLRLYVQRTKFMHQIDLGAIVVADGT